MQVWAELRWPWGNMLVMNHGIAEFWTLFQVFDEIRQCSSFLGHHGRTPWYRQAYLNVSKMAGFGKLARIVLYPLRSCSNTW
jgi:hypothetical protein